MGLATYLFLKWKSKFSLKEKKNNSFMFLTNLILRSGYNNIWPQAIHWVKIFHLTSVLLELQVCSMGFVSGPLLFIQCYPIPLLCGWQPALSLQQAQLHSHTFITNFLSEVKTWLTLNFLNLNSNETAVSRLLVLVLHIFNLSHQKLKCPWVLWTALANKMCIIIIIRKILFQLSDMLSGSLTNLVAPAEALCFHSQ